MSISSFAEELSAVKAKERVGYNAFSEYLEEKARRELIPLNGQLELTPMCNLDCRMCYVHLLPEQMDRPLLSVNEWKHLIDEAYERGLLQVNLTGGECLTYPGFDEVYLYLQSKGIQISVLTNGVLLDEKRIGFFRKHKPADIQITLYGSNDDAYERVTGKRCQSIVTDNIIKAKEAGLLVILSVTPSIFMGEDVFSVLELGKKLGVSVYINTSMFDPRQETGRAGQDVDVDTEMYARIWRWRQEHIFGETTSEIPLDELPKPGGCHAEGKKGLECGGGRSGFVIDWKGAMHICNRLPFSSYPFRDGFDTAWKQLNEYALNYPYVSECDDCAYKQVCDRCAGRMRVFAEPGERPEGLCEKTRYLVHRGVVSIPECD